MGWILSLGEGLKVGCSDLMDLESRNVFLECFECIRITIISDNPCVEVNCLIV